MGKYIGATTAPVLKENNHYMTSDFGMRKLNGVEKMHNGIDLINRGKVKVKEKPTSDYIIAVADGKVTYVGYSNSRGYYVEIKHANNFKTRYLHMKKGTFAVAVNQLVKKGQTLGFTGATGEGVTGVHCHFAVVNASGKYVDPKPYLLGQKDFKGNDWETGSYSLLYHKYLRNSPKVKSDNKVKYSELKSQKAKDNCTKDVLGYAKTKIGAVMKFDEFKFDNKGNRWGRTTNSKKYVWVCVEDKNGKQVKKV